jgi:1-acyl-sn-glycerol-3-phosphate acyltransferase
VLYAVLRSFAAALAHLLFRIEVRGAEHVPRTGPAMIVANHSSVLDPPVVGAGAPRPLHFMAKAELFSIPLFGRLLRAVNARPVRREGADARALREALRILESGHALLVFPEGTRGPEGALREGKAGAGMLALLSGARVVPAFVEGTGRALPRGRAIPRPVRVRVSFGPPLAFAKVEGPHRKERYLEASREMMAAIARLKHATERGMTATEIGHKS